MSGSIVADASALVDLLAGGPSADWVADRLSDAEVVAPGHARAEILFALGRRHRSGEFDVSQVEALVARASRIPLIDHPVGELLLGAWHRRSNLSLADALYVELAAQLDTVVVTTDHRLARATPLAVAPPG